MIWPIFTQNPWTIPTMVVVGIHISRIRLEDWNKFISQRVSKEPSTTTSANTQDLTITAKEENLIQLLKRRKMMFFRRVKIIGQEATIEKETTSTNTKIPLTPDWADQKCFKRRSFRKLVRDFSKILLLMSKWCTRVFSQRASNHQWLKSNLPETSWQLSLHSMIELFTIWTVLLRLITENTTKLKNHKIITKSRCSIIEKKFNF